MISFGRISSKSMMSLMLLMLSELSYECCVLLSHLKQKSFCKLFGMLQGSVLARIEKQTQQHILSLCQDLLTVDEERNVDVTSCLCG